MIAMEIKNDEITAALEGIARALENPLPLFQDLGEYLVLSTKQRFPTGRAPDGSVWAPKSPVTITAQGGRRTNRLDTRPLFGPSGALSSTITYEAFSDRVEWGSPMIYSAVQQFGAGQGAFGRTSRGGPIPWGDIPARPFVGLSVEDEGAVLDIVADYLSGAAGQPL
jgi:phage virion morphogenesis protein